MSRKIFLYKDGKLLVRHRIWEKYDEESWKGYKYDMWMVEVNGEVNKL